MPLFPTPLRALFSPGTAASSTSALPPPRRPPLAGALLFLSLGAVAGCALSTRRLPFLRSETLQGNKLCSNGVYFHDRTFHCCVCDSSESGSRQKAISKHYQ
uniref:Uncharacterized protein n=1 Tax=Triticum urartu TaxID=4572 RepID=A0A8R7PJI0_TRIUA